MIIMSIEIYENFIKRMSFYHNIEISERQIEK